ncbi:AMP-binding protein, partial [Falsiroseomonas oryzae]|uniref:AMP-binding protein n=1 Tax=Falsiroseomonas oryzae TaxID=2766473 RepID=UPI0022EAA493
ALGLPGVVRAAEEAGGPTMIQGLPSLVTALLQAPGAAAAFRRVRRCQCAGTQLLASDIQALRAVLPPDCNLRNVYGLTESSGVLSWDVPPDWQPQGPRVPAGLPVPGQRIELVDESGAAVPPGEVGEIVVSGPLVALGEWRDGRLVPSPRIAPAPDRPGERVLHTGDLGRIRPDGLYEVVGRADRQVKIGGRRVELEEIEDRLRRAPGVAAAAVLADR